MQDKIKEIVSKSPHFTLIEDDVLGIVKRLQDFDSSYFVVRNHLEERFEIHSTDNIGLTYCFAAPGNTLDYRTLEYAKKTYVPAKGESIIKTLEQYNNRASDERKKDIRKTLKEGAYQSREYFERAYLKMEQGEGYKKSVFT